MKPIVKYGLIALLVAGAAYATLRAYKLYKARQAAKV
jgi:hypothetical protein